ncbi:DUF2087 domain-containing protein [Deinococcus sp. Leaf326]|uniref:DUF2087 domain-containing protein n=1 Tax=Deinococcus sp. Leaf326 TaxID=1736338 RepID=UPI0006F2E040|nr:DUF2087 domain-containing protein [Deinococcus sp. Leaf326]KQR28074.1 hypothetical protein ASF71_05750 [Deinococcus sp. Leaf326]
MTKSITDFQDERGRITNWPSDRRVVQQQAILHHLRGLFESGVSYGRPEVDRLLATHTTLEDPSILIPELVEGDYLATDGQTYWRADGRPGVAAPDAEPRG